MGKGQNTTTNQTSSSADPQAAQAYRDLLQRAQGVASTPYQAYTGELTAPVNAQQNLGVGNINSNAGFAQAPVNQALGIAGSAANPLTQQQIQQYQNPYTQNVVDATQAQFNRNNAQQQAALKGNTISSGALGGNREGIAQANLSSQQATQQNPIIAKMYADSYNQGVATAGQQFQQNPLAAAGSLANFGISGQGAALSGAGAQLGAGTLQQQTEQQRLNALYGQYQQAQAYPYQQTQWLAGLDTGVGSNLGGSSAGSTTGPAPNQTAQYAGLGLAAAGMFLNRGGRVGYADGGGVVPHMADGGMPGVPWSGGVGWIPQMNIHGGSGAPHGSAPGAPSQGTAFDPTKFAASLTGLGGKGAGVGNAVGAYFNPEAYGASYTGMSGAGAYGGSSASPLTGLSADDYGPGFRRGGVVGYAGGGAPPIDFTDPAWENPDVGPGIGPAGFADRFAPAGENPFGAMPKAQGVALREKPPVINPDAPIRMPDQAATDGWRSGPPPAPAAGAPVQAKEEDDAELPANATPTQGGPQGRGVASAGFTPPYPVDVPSGVVPPKESGFGLGLISPNAKTGLLTAGLSMLASRSPNLGNAIGEGGLAGFGAYGSAEEHDRKVASEAQKLSTEAKKAANDLAAKTYTLNTKGDMTDYQREQLKQKATEDAIKLKTPIKIGETRSGAPIMAMPRLNPQTKQIDLHPINSDGSISDQPIKPGAKAAGATADAVSAESAAPPPEVRAQAPPGSPQARNEAYLADIAKTDPGYAANIKAIVDYQANPSMYSVRNNRKEKVMADVYQYDPTYDSRRYASTNDAIKKFGAGPQGNAIRSFNVAIEHLGTAEELGKALQNGDSQTINKLKNTIKTQFGYDAEPSFNTAKIIVGDEIAKAVIGGQSALADREHLQKNLQAASSPAQLAGVIKAFKTLMAGQVIGLKKQYEDTTGLHNFDSRMTPRTIDALKAVGYGHDDAAVASKVAPAGGTSAAASPPAIAPAAIDMLKKNPALAPQFDQKYGAGASRQYLAQ